MVRLAGWLPEAGLGRGGFVLVSGGLLKRALAQRPA